MPKPDSFERSLLRDADVKFGFDNYEVLQQIGTFVRQLRRDDSVSESDLVDTGIEAAAIDESPSLLTLVRLAHAAGKQLVIRLEDVEGLSEGVEVLRI